MSPLDWRVLLAGVAVVAAVWATWPSGGQINLSTCQPSGLFGPLSARLYGVTFWKAQLSYLRDAEIGAHRLIGTLHKAQSDADRATDEARTSQDQIYRKHPSLAPSPAQEHAERLRRQADRIEGAAAIDSVVQRVQGGISDYRACARAISAGELK